MELPVRIPLMTALAGLVLLASLTSIVAQEAKEPPAPPPVVVLDTVGFWRMHHTLKPPVIQHGRQLKPVLLNVKWLDWETDGPAADWRRVDFDDSSWTRFPLRRSAITSYLSRLCLRGKFRVTRPDQVKALRLSLDYHGGAIVTVNGREVARGHVPRGESDIAEAYPEEAFTASGRAAGTLRLRSLTDVPIAASVLREGVNVVAIELVRAPYHQCLEPKEVDGRRAPYELAWNTCRILRVQLVADTADGLVPNAVRHDGLQVWNSDPLAGDFDLDFGDPCEPLRPVHVVGARNGTHSGKVVVGSTRPIHGLKATASDLRGPGGGAIPASAVRVRYGIPWGHEYTVRRHTGPTPYPAVEGLLGALAESAPEEIPVYEKALGEHCVRTPNQPAPVFGAVASVWATVTVPADAPAGLYRGRLTIDVQGEKAMDVPLEVKVVDWTLPEPHDYTTWVEFIESPDTLAVEYDLEPWSQRHWEMIAQSFRHIGQVGSRVVYVPLIARSNLGNEHSMVRWIRKADGRYEFDFSIMDRYLDTAERYIGKPANVCFNVWEIYLLEKEKFKPSSTMSADWIRARKAYAGKGPVVTVLDPAAGTLENVHLPSFTHEESMDLWKPLFDATRSRMEARGLEDAMTLGFISDVLPTKDEVRFLHEASGGLPWTAHSHHPIRKVHGIGDVVYQACVWNIGFPGDTSMMGWKGKWLVAQYQRGNQNAASAARWRHGAEVNIAGRQRGIGRLGADFWFAVKDKHGRRVGTVAGRYPESAWRNLNLYSHFLAPGPDGPIATNRFEAIREGVQECEARIAVERALSDPVLREKLGDELAGRAKQILDERLLYMWKGFSTLRLCGPRWTRATSTPWRGSGVPGHVWFLGSGWQQRSEKLYVLAGEVSKRLGRR